MDSWCFDYIKNDDKVNYPLPNISQQCFLGFGGCNHIESKQDKVKQPIWQKQVYFC